MVTNVDNLTEKVIAVGEIAKYVMIQKCYICHNVFVMSNMDYFNKKCGCSIKSHKEDIGDCDDWCCNECADRIKKIRDL